MIGFLKKLFASKHVVEEERVALQQLEEWFSERSKPLIEDVYTSIIDVTKRMSEEIELSKTNIDGLRTATLQNPNIEVREKQFMEGNRDSYILGFESFLKTLTLPANGAMDDYLGQFPASLERFTKATVRPYQILQHFFANETRELALRVKRLEDLYTELSSLHTGGSTGKIADLKDAIRAFQSSLSKRTDYGNQLDVLKDELGAQTQEKNALQKKLDGLYASSGFKDLLALKADKAIIVKQLQEHYGVIRQPFSTLEAALKKYQRITLDGEEVIGWYLLDAVQAIERDSSLRIVELVATLQKALVAGTIDLRDKKKEKAVAACSLVTSELLKNHQNKLALLKSTLEEKGRLASEHAALREEEALQDLLSEVTKKIEHIVADRTELQSSLDKIDIDHVKEKIAEDLSSFLEKKIIIS